MTDFGYEWGPYWTFIQFSALKAAGGYAYYFVMRAFL